MCGGLKQEHEKFYRLTRIGRLDVSALISREFKLVDAPKAYDIILSKNE